MTKLTNRFSAYWAELQRRKLVRTAITYLILFFAVIGPTSDMLEGLNAPEWIIQYVIVGMLVSFPVVLILSWKFDFTLHGIYLTKPLESEVEEVTASETLIDEPEGVQEDAGPTDFGISDAQKHRVTLLRCSIITSKEGNLEDDPESIFDQLPRLNKIIESLCTRYAATILSMEGTTFELLFGYPKVSDNDPARAIATGLAIQNELEHLNSKEDIQELVVSIGIHSDEAVINPSDNGALNIVGNISQFAAWLQTQSPANTVTLDSSTYRLLRGRVECEEIGERTNYQTDSEVSIYRAIAMRDASESLQDAHHAIPEMIGRESEINMLLDRWDDAQEGDRKFVILRGEAGIGKTRLIQEIIKRAALCDSFTPMIMHCSQLGENIPFQSVIEYLMGSGLGLRKLEGMENKTQRIRKALENAGIDADLAAPLINSLLSFESQIGEDNALNSEVHRKELLSYLVELVNSVAKHNSLLLIIEDLHWADPSTLEIVNMLISENSDSGMLCIFTSRPDSNFDWESRSNVATINLERLSRRATRDLIRNAAHGKDLSEELVDRLLEEVSGSPLFAEELTKGIVESSQNEGKSENQQWVLPNTLQQSLSARLDNLGTAKPLAQLCSLLGREFGYELLLATSQISDAEKLNRDLDSLVNAELLYQTGSLPDSRYQFKHALIRDTAYKSILKSNRIELHARVAECIAEAGLERGEDLTAVLAHHYEYSEQIDKSFKCYFTSCHKALSSFAFGEAIECADKGLMVMTKLPESKERDLQEISVLSMLGKALINSKGYSYPRVEKVFSKAVLLCDSVNEFPQSFQLLVGLWGYFQIAGMKDLQCDLVEKLKHAEEIDSSPAKTVQSLYCEGFTLFKLGDFHEAREKLVRAQDIIRYNEDDYCQFTLSGDDSRVHIPGVLALVECCLGRNARAIELSDEAVALSEETGNQVSIVWAYFFRSWVMQSLGNVEEAGVYAHKALEISRKYELSFWIYNSMYLVRWSEFQQCEDDPVEKRNEIISEMIAIIEGFMTLGVRFGVLPMYLEVCLAYLELEDCDAAKIWIDKSSQLLDECGDEYLRGEIYRIQGLLNELESKPDLALDNFNKAKQQAALRGDERLLNKTVASLAQLKTGS